MDIISKSPIDNNYDSLSLQEKQELHKLFFNKSAPTELKQKLEKIIFRLSPPTPQEYLDHANGWITKAFADSIYEYIKEDFCEILSEEKNYSQAVEYGATRLGKSYLARMIIHYIVIYVHCLRHPQLYYGLSPTTSLSIYIMSFVAEKTNQLLLKPIYDIFDMSPRFKRVDRQDLVAVRQKEIGLETIVWSKAATFGHLTLESKLSLNTGTDFMSFIGADLLFLVVSEINFFIEKAGATHDQIFQLYTDGLARIRATVGNNYLGMVFLDSSANDLDNPIEQYILGELKNQESVFFRQRSKWEVKDGKRKQLGPNKFPKWMKTGEEFKVCIGDNNTQARIIEDEKELLNLPAKLIYKIPIDLKENFKQNINKAIKDDLGLPTKRENKFVQDPKDILSIFNNKFLYNIEGLLYADASEMPQELLWKQLYKFYFIKYTEATPLILKRAPNEPRYIGLDLAHSIKGDIQGIAMLHKEWSRRINKIIFVHDFCFGIGGKTKGINLEAGTFLILDLIQRGLVQIKGVYVDQFQSQTLIQNLERYKILAVKQSVDKTLEPYQAYYTYIINEQIKGGKNVFWKNNLDSLISIKDDRGKDKIDHSMGTTENIYTGNFEYSKAGINAKDVSDASCQAFWGALNDDTTHPSVCYEDENDKVNPEVDKSNSIKLAFSKLHKYY